MTKPQVVILGGGPAGLGAAYQLSRGGHAQVTLLERNNWVGGNAGSFELAGLCVDYGSHRLHPACDPEILQDIRALLGDDLLDRPRHGRIRLQNRWIHFPLRPLDLVLQLPPRFAAGIVADLVTRFRKRPLRDAQTETFASVMERGLGRTICRDFYFPYARKVWGLEPDALSPTQARRRVSAGSVRKMAQKVFTAVPGFKPKGSGRFFYPRHGYGQISEAYYHGALEAGASILMNASVKTVETQDGHVSAVGYEKGGELRKHDADYVWSTIPITILARTLQPALPERDLRAAKSIDFRGMILVYLVLEQDRFSEYDAHYFPETRIPFSRVSEPKNYSNSQEPRGLTVLCGELPGSPDGPEWNQSDEELGVLMRDALAQAGIPLNAPIRQVRSIRLRQAYPIYRRGYEDAFEQLDERINQIDGLLTFGRQGLFAHDNTHHALYMAYSAARCLDAGGRFDRARWNEYRRIFETHVVED